MEENIPFRQLRKLKPQTISHTSQKLLRPIFRHRSQHKVDNDIMNQNVTQYQYMLKDPHVKENYINWATNLRGYDVVQMKQNMGSDPPSVFYKQTKLQQLRLNPKTNRHSQHINTAQFSQFFGRDATNIPQGEINFLNQLRDMNIKQTLNHDKKFYNYGAKTSQTLPKLLKKNAIKKLKNMSSSDFDDRLDGTHQYPEYTYKNLREKNSALLRVLAKHHEKVSLPGIAWSVGLRSY